MALEIHTASLCHTTSRAALLIVAFHIAWVRIAAVAEGLAIASEDFSIAADKWTCWVGWTGEIIAASLEVCSWNFGC